MTTSSAPDWVAALRHGLRGQVGKGWSIRPIRGCIQITCRFTDGKRTSVVTDLPWSGSSQAKLLAVAERLKDRVYAGESLGSAYEAISAAVGTQDACGLTDWAVVAERFRAFKIQSGAVSERTWHRNYKLPIERALLVLNGRPAPISGSTLLQTLVTKYPMQPGSTARRLLVQYVSQFLRFAVDRQGIEQRWLPPADLLHLTGIKQKGQVLAAFASDDQIKRLLAGIDDQKWRTAVGLVACFGLRPVELFFCQSNGDRLHVSYRKRTARKPEGTPVRDVVGLDPEGCEGLSGNLLAILAEHGQSALPKACRTERAGAALNQYLRRNATWQRLVEETAALGSTGNTGTQLVPYSLRHAYSARCHRYGLNDRTAALMMGHSLLVHNQTYAGTAADEVDQVVARVQRHSSAVKEPAEP